MAADGGGDLAGLALAVAERGDVAADGGEDAAQVGAEERIAATRTGSPSPPLAGKRDESGGIAEIEPGMRGGPGIEEISRLKSVASSRA